MVGAVARVLWVDRFNKAAANRCGSQFNSYTARKELHGASIRPQRIAADHGQSPVWMYVARRRLQ